MNAFARTWLGVGALGLVLGLAACSDDSSTTADAPVVKLPDAAVVFDAKPATPDAAAPDAPPADCVSGTPATNEDLLNACTTAQRITHNPTLPLLNADGSLPAHP